jgi:NAD(P)-dependent dehydrogenase (short-subunit alcohol dehydrogenase family)
MPESPVTVITGAGSGLGQALAIRLASAKHRLALAGRRKEALLDTEALCTEALCEANGGRLGGTLILPIDVTQAGAPDHIVAETLRAFGRIDALVNNAAQACFAPLAQTTDQLLEEMTAINLMAPLRLVRAAEPALRSSRGVVVNVGSIGGVLALPGRAAYGATKAALHHLTRSLARELAPDIRVNAVLPGAIDTEMYDHTGLSAADTAALRAEMIRTTPMGRLGTPADVVPWIELLLGSAGRWVTGSLLVVDGGRAC